ncbi:MAG: hypothetical protein R3E12_09945 [Candidatus Eisenbacteria bacterium]
MREPRIEMPPLEPSDLEPRPLVDAETIPADWYVDPRFHDLDRVAVLARSWQLVGHASQIPEPGDLLCLTVAGEPILAVRERTVACAGSSSTSAGTVEGRSRSRTGR